MKNRVVISSLFLVGCLILGAVFGIYSSHYYQRGNLAKPDINGLLWPNPKVLLPFSLVNHKLETFDLDDLDGKWTFLFFGYTHCPDICPITLSTMNRMYKTLASGNQADQIQMVFISVDPERDTPEKLAEYIEYFNAAFTGVTGSNSDLESLTRQMGIVYARSDNTEPGEYLVDHSASIFLVAPGHEWLGIFSAPHDEEDILRRFRAMKDFYKKTDA